MFNIFFYFSILLAFLVIWHHFSLCWRDAVGCLVSAATLRSLGFWLLSSVWLRGVLTLFLTPLEDVSLGSDFNVIANSHLLICRQSWNTVQELRLVRSRSLKFTFTGRIQSIVDENGVGAVREEAPFVWVQCVDTSLKSLWLFGSCVHSRFFSAGIRPTELDESFLLSDWTPCLLFFFFFFYSHCLSVLVFECACVFVYFI